MGNRFWNFRTLGSSESLNKIRSDQFWKTEKKHVRQKTYLRDKIAFSGKSISEKRLQRLSFKSVTVKQRKIAIRKIHTWFISNSELKKKQYDFFIILLKWSFDQFITGSRRPSLFQHQLRRSISRLRFSH